MHLKTFTDFLNEAMMSEKPVQWDTLTIKIEDVPSVLEGDMPIMFYAPDNNPRQNLRDLIKSIASSIEKSSKYVVHAIKDCATLAPEDINVKLCGPQQGGKTNVVIFEEIERCLPTVMTAIMRFMDKLPDGCQFVFISKSKDALPTGLLNRVKRFKLKK